MAIELTTQLTASSEALTPEEAQQIAPYFSNTDRSVVALVNLPEVVKGALFARYSRSAKGVRRLFLDEFFGKSELALDQTFEVTETSRVLSQASEARAKAEAFYTRVLSDYGDDSVGELGGAHLAFQEISQIAAETIEDHRIGLAFLEKSSRYVPFDDKVNGQYRYYRDRNLVGSVYGERVIGHLDGLFDSYATMLPRMSSYLEETYPIGEIEFENAITGEVQKFADITDEEFSKSAAFAYKSAVRAQACDLLRCFLPMATLTNVGVWGNGRALEYLLLHLLADPFAENRLLGRAGSQELDTVIGPFIKRADDEKGKRLQEYLQGRRVTQKELVKRYLGELKPAEAPSTKPKVTLTRFDSDAVDSIVRAILFGATDADKCAVNARVGELSAEEKMEIIRAYVGIRGKPAAQAGTRL